MAKKTGAKVASSKKTPESDELSSEDILELGWLTDRFITEPERGHFIGLAAAYDEVFRAYVPEWEDLYDRANEVEGQYELQNELEDGFIAVNAALEDLERGWRRANEFFRAKLASGELKACLKSDENNEAHYLPPSGWEMQDSSDPAILSNFITARSPRPVSAKNREVFLVRSEFEQWLSSIFPGHGGGRGRPRGSGAYAIQDQKIHQKMHKYIKRNKSNAWRAAGHFARRAAGGGTEYSKRRRLYEGYKAFLGRK